MKNETREGAIKLNTRACLAALGMLAAVAACREKETPTRLPIEELRVPADDVTLHVRIAGNPQVEVETKSALGALSRITLNLSSVR